MENSNITSKSFWQRPEGLVGSFVVQTTSLFNNPHAEFIAFFPVASGPGCINICSDGQESTQPYFFHVQIVYPLAYRFIYRNKSYRYIEELHRRFKGKPEKHE